jgi:hypothetical protein
MSLRSIITERQLELTLSALEKAKKHALAVANRPVQGHGSASEQSKKDNWRIVAEDIEETIDALRLEWD